MRPLLSVDGLSVGFRLREPARLRSRFVRVLDNFEMALGQNETVGIVGESGSGKSTAARGMLRLTEIEAGSILLDGVDISGLTERQLKPYRRQAQMVFQDPFSSLNPAMTVEKIVGEPLTLVGGMKGARRRQAVLALLDRVALGEYVLDRYPREFSGGQLQRIAIARALAPGPKVLVLDEAVSALDVSTQNQVVFLLRQLREELGFGMVFISHDLSVVRHMADKVIVMYCGQIVERGPTARVFSAPQHPYTMALLSAVPALTPRARDDRERILLQGEPANPLDPPSGCRFHERCPFVVDKCKVEEPMPEAVAGGVVTCHHHSDGTVPPEMTV